MSIKNGNNTAKVNSQKRPHPFDAPTSPEKRTKSNNQNGTETTCKRDYFAFMNLPAEIRNHIYEQVIEDMSTTPGRDIDIGKCSHKNRRYLDMKRRNLIACRLGEVSRTVRQEFVPMLWSRLHFHLCACVWPNDKLHVPEAVVARLLRGHVKHLRYRSHYNLSKLETGGELKRIAEAMLTLDFKGAFTFVGFKYHNIAIRKCLRHVITAIRAGAYQADAIEMGERLYCVERGRFRTLLPWPGR